jgi:UDP-N-acetylmuramate dehydrogenase
MAPLADYTTLRLGGPADRLVEARTEAELVEAARAGAYVLAGGSNVVIADEGVRGTVVLVRTRGVERDGSSLVVAAGEDWDPLVARCAAEGLQGFECLSGIPGSAGATPIQNVGAYGQDVSETVQWVRVYDRATDEVRVMDAAECGFTYRRSVFKHRDRWVVLAVAYRLCESPESGPLRYAELARALDVPVGGRARLADVRAAVLALRRRKGMVIDPADPDSVSAGSFFTNPILDAGQVADLEKRVADRLGPDAAFPRYPEIDGHVKTSAAWLIDKAGFAKGHARGPVRISTKHTLALTNPGGARTADLLALAREVRDGVREAFGVTMVNEPVFVGVRL